MAVSKRSLRNTAAWLDPQAVVQTNGYDINIGSHNSSGTTSLTSNSTRTASDRFYRRSIGCMAHAWLLVETLGDEPAVVAQGRQLKNLVPITVFLRRSPYLSAVRTAIAESVQTGQSLTSITPKHDRVIRTEPVVMSDGRMHGVHVWTGPADVDPPERPVPGPLKWDLTLGVATDTRESLANSGKDPEVEVTLAERSRKIFRPATSIRTKAKC